jgi:exopolysaccharide biosynthesis polyprenyl glycosylphosphotransferase
MAQVASKEVRETGTVSRQPLQRRSAKRIVARVIADGMAVLTSLFLASTVRYEVMAGAPAHGVNYTSVTLLALPVWLLLFRFYGLYEPRQVLSPVNEFKQVFHGVVAGTVLIVMADSIFEWNLARSWILLAMVCSFAIVGGERLVVRKVLHFLRRRGGDMTRVIMLGANHEARTVAKTLEREAWLGYHIIGFVDDHVPAGTEVVNGHRVIGHAADIHDLVEDRHATLVMVAASAFDTARLNRLFWELQDVDVDLQVTSGTIDLMASRMIVQSVAGVPLFFIRRTGMDTSQATLKRSIDIIGSLFGLIVLSPFLLATAIWVRLDSQGSPFFRQVRIGRDGRPFRVWKFRTMVADAEEKRAELEPISQGPGLLFKLKDDPRVTRAGRFLRRFSLDEFPQLFNVLVGEMSLVGPRPALPTEVEEYDDWVRNRLKVKPGMTGLWQVSGRTDTSFEDYVRYDLFYIQNWSLSLDVWILWRTFRAVISGEGAS